MPKRNSTVARGAWQSGIKWLEERGIAISSTVGLEEDGVATKHQKIYRVVWRE